MSTEVNESSFPLVSIVIPMRNEELFISLCLDSVLKSDYPETLMEILVVDGMSTDRSLEIVQEYAEKFPSVRLLENLKRFQVSALNIGLREAKGEILVRMDAHTTYASDYVRKCVKLLQTSDAQNVGGVQHALGKNYITNAIAIATTSRFGAGDAKFRYSEKEQWVDTVYLGAWYKKTLEDLGGFNEEWLINEDYELNYRLRKSGGKILLSPEIKCKYFVRSSLWKLAKQYFRYGCWKIKTLVIHPDSLRWRQLAPPLFVMALIISICLVPFFWPAALIIPGLYLMTNLSASLITSIKKGLLFLPVLPLIFIILHICWGAGFWFGILRFGIPKLSLKVIAASIKKVRA